MDDVSRAVGGSADGTSAPAHTEPTGPRRALIALYATFALAATARALVQIFTRFEEAPTAYVLSLASGLIYLTATVGIATSWRISRPMAWVSVVIELVGVIVVGILSLVDAAAFPDDTVWSRFGSGYLFIPAVLPLIGIAWLWYLRRLERKTLKAS